MQLPGRLALTTIGDLLGRLHRARASGALELACNGKRHRVHLHRGLVSALDLDVESPPARFGEVMVEHMLARAADVVPVLSRKETFGAEAPPLGEMLVRAGVITAEVRDAGLRKQARARLDALFTMLDGRDAEIRFHVGVSVGVRSMQHMVAPLLPREFLHGRGRARNKGRVAANDGSPLPPRYETRPPHTHASYTPGPTDARLTPARIAALRTLGLAAHADADEIRRAFRAAAARMHPDRHPAAPASERARLHTAFAELSAAYHTLCA